MENPASWNDVMKVINNDCQDDLTATKIISILDKHSLLKNNHPDLERTIEWVLIARIKDAEKPLREQSMAFQSLGAHIYFSIKGLGVVD